MTARIIISFTFYSAQLLLLLHFALAPYIIYPASIDVVVASYCIFISTFHDL